MLYTTHQYYPCCPYSRRYLCCADRQQALGGDDCHRYVIIGIIALAVLILATLTVIIYCVRQLRQQKLRTLDLININMMDGLVFEKYVAELLKHQGYHHVTLTQQYDYGIDIIAQKDGVTWGI